MRFTRSVTTVPTTTTVAPAINTGRMVEKKDTEQLPWKLPVFVSGPLLVALGKLTINVVKFVVKTSQIKLKLYELTRKKVKRIVFDNLRLVQSYLLK